MRTLQQRVHRVVAHAVQYRTSVPYVDGMHPAGVGPTGRTRPLREVLVAPEKAPVLWSLLPPYATSLAVAGPEPRHYPSTFYFGAGIVQFRLRAPK
jgi:hypothetical protein